ncbi:GNAT family acetyltransferase [Thorsellia kenyensis]|uniref:GNAT family acetyltransferase n=1 Tax=Thorsellia kenyensis TaxID=1549888 RepID=A0ABV6C762_9GAMM
MIIRTFKDEDFDSVITLWERCHLNSDEGDLELDIELKLAHGISLFLVAEASGQVVGTLLGGYNGQTGTGSHLAVHPEFRGRGIANALITRLEKKLSAMGCPKLEFSVSSENYMLIHMFENLSYNERNIVVLEKTILHKAE